MNKQSKRDGNGAERPAPRAAFQRTSPVAAEVLSIGRELLRGQVEDANAGNLARLLTLRGTTVRRITTVGDTEAAIAEALSESLHRELQLVVVTGGLGPGTDDRTIAALSAALHLPLAVNHGAREMVEAAYQRMRQERLVHKGGLTAAREKMCTLPVGAAAVENPVGVSPGVLYRIAGGATLLCLPGLPAEAEAVFLAAASQLKLPASGNFLARREIEAPTADESSLYPMLEQLTAEFPRVWIHSGPLDRGKPGTKIMINLEATGATQQEANAGVDGVVKRLLALAAGSP